MPAIIVPNAEPLYIDQNGRITCKAHRPSSDFRTTRLSDEEIAEWKVEVREITGQPDALPCESCETKRRNAGPHVSQGVEAGDPYPDGTVMFYVHCSCGWGDCRATADEAETSVQAHIAHRAAH